MIAGLVHREMGEGEIFLQELDKQGVPVSAAFWLYSDEWGGYRLVVATSVVDAEGSRAAYKLILPVLRSFPKPLSIDVNDVTVVSPNERIVRNLRDAVGTGPGVSGIRFSRNMVHGDYIEDAYVYRT